MGKGIAPVEPLADKFFNIFFSLVCSMFEGIF